jgi:hypothetical protein
LNPFRFLAAADELSICVSQEYIYYFYNDHLGSLIAVQKQGTTALAAEFSYDPWGRRRNPDNWTDNDVTEPTLFTRGYTGHEHIGAYSLINMNGRMGVYPVYTGIPAWAAS